jgi:hypothetical protein
MKEAKMKLKQISVPIENDHDRTYELTKALGDKGINLRALSLVDTGYYGELRILVSDVPAARHILMQKGIPAHIDEVIAVEVEDARTIFEFTGKLKACRYQN